MALLFADPGGKFYSSAAQMVQGLYQTAAIGGITTSGLPQGAIESTAISGNVTLVITVPQTAGPYTCGFRCYIPNSIGNAQNFLQFLDASGGQQLTFQTNLNGTISLKQDGGNGPLLGTSSLSSVLTANTWNYVEFQAKVNNSVGTAAVQINGINVMSLTSINTQGTGQTVIGGVQINGVNNAGFLVQDIYITDSTTSINNGFLGDVSMPVANAFSTGTYNQFSPNGAATNWQCVADVTPDDLTTYTFDSTPGDRFSVGYNVPGVSGNILGVVHVSRVEKSDAGARTFSQTMTSNGVDVIATAQAPATTFAYFTQVVPTDPSTGIAWTNTGLAAAQGGLKTVS